MKELLDKISSYNIFNFLLPGIIFVVIASHISHLSFVQEDLLVGAFVYYFIGLVISRFGSLVLEPILRKAKLLGFADYRQYVNASKKDGKIGLLSEVNNTYRTLCSLFVLLILLRVFERLGDWWPSIRDFEVTAFLVLLMILFVFSYRKQTGYIKKRIEANG